MDLWRATVFARRENPLGPRWLMAFYPFGGYRHVQETICELAMCPYLTTANQRPTRPNTGPYSPKLQSRTYQERSRPSVKRVQ